MSPGIPPLRKPEWYDGEPADPIPRVAWVLAVACILTGAVIGWTLTPPRCADTWTLALPGTSGECPVGAYVAEHPETGGGALVVCRCRPEPRTHTPESRQ